MTPPAAARPVLRRRRRPEKATTAPGSTWWASISPQPNYPFQFVQADALEMLRVINLPVSRTVWVGCPEYLLWHVGKFDAIHASPPCQDYSKAMRHLSGDFPRLIDPVREALIATRLPWVIENW